jgi:oligosaccharide reducing-end xylanase
MYMRTELKIGAVTAGASLLVLLAGCAHATPSPEPAGAFATGHYRNLFVENGHRAPEVSARINAAFEQLFNGDPGTQAICFAAGTNDNGALAYVCDVGHHDVRSEGMSYGMMIAVQLNRKAVFDALWNWARTYMYHGSTNHPCAGFFSWQMRTNGTPIDEMAAPDGEEYFVTALYFASARWGDADGIYDYRAEADQLLSDMRHRSWITGQTAGGRRTAGALFDERRKMVRFTPDRRYGDHTDPSYQLPAFYELWGRWGPEEDRAFWRDAAAASREFFQRAADPKTGLAPEYANFDGSPWVAPWNPGSGDFRFDAWRVAMNWSVDWAWWAADPRERRRSDRLQAFFQSRGIATYGNQFTLAGKQLGDDHATGLVAMNAVASLAAADPRARKFVEALWTCRVPAGPWRYYDGLLYLMGMLHCSGQFRIWSPH